MGRLYARHTYAGYREIVDLRVYVLNSSNPYTRYYLPMKIDYNAIGNFHIYKGDLHRGGGKLQYVRTYVCMYVCMYVRMYVRTYQ